MFCVQKRYSAWEIMSIFRKHHKCLVRCCNNNNNDLCLSGGGGNFNEGEKCIIWFVKRMLLQLYLWADADFRLSIYLPSKQQGSKKHWAFATNVNLYRKGLKARYLTASLDCRQPLSHPTPSVFHAEQHGMRTFLIRTLGLEFQGHPHPHGGPQHQQGQGLILEHIS